MKKITSYSRVILFTSSILLLTQLSCSSNKSGKQQASTTTASGKSLSIAYVDIDSFEANYTYLKEQREKFAQKQASMEAELQRSAQQLQSSAQSADQKARAGNMSQVEFEATQKKLAQMQQSLQLREQSLTQQLLKEKDEFNDKLHKDLDSFIKEYNKEGKYDFILSYSSIGSQLLYVNDAYDITQDVIKGMNAKAPKVADSDSTKKK